MKVSHCLPACGLLGLAGVRRRPKECRGHFSVAAFPSSAPPPPTSLRHCRWLPLPPRGARTQREISCDMYRQTDLLPQTSMHPARHLPLPLLPLVSCLKCRTPGIPRYPSTMLLPPFTPQVLSESPALSISLAQPSEQCQDACIPEESAREAPPPLCGRGAEL